MKKIAIFVLIITLAFLAQVSAEPNLEVEIIPIQNTLIAGLDEPATFELEINNLGEKETFEIYTIVGGIITPTDFFELPEGKTTLKITALPNTNLRNKAGPLIFQYQIKGQKSGFFIDDLIINFVDLKDAIEITPMDFNPEDGKINILLKNTLDMKLTDVTISLDSTFFDNTQTLSLEPLEERTIEIPLNIDSTGTISAGLYIIDVELELEGTKSEKEVIINYAEKENLITDTNTEGFIIKTTLITKTNQGNTQALAKMEVKRGIISRFFTINTPDADRTERSGLSLIYHWSQSLSPGESFSIKSTTNHTIPFILLILIASATVMARRYFATALTVKKKVSFVKTKSGKFALKVTLNIKAKSTVKNIKIIERLPATVKLYEGFGKLPDKIDKDSRRLIWHIAHLNAGEEKVYSYIIYSKLNVVGRFELPQGLAIFDKDGITQEVLSNKASFMAENNSQ